jgi:hypothetical protein
MEPPSPNEIEGYDATPVFIGMSLGVPTPRGVSPELADVIVARKSKASNVDFGQ